MHDDTISTDERKVTYKYTSKQIRSLKCTIQSKVSHSNYLHPHPKKREEKELQLQLKNIIPIALIDMPSNEADRNPVHIFS